ncbi:MAG TPA: methyltransferase domain-containing protein, partial [Rhodothermales bacterium]|nr:methyltransferase domain-containing protein [Rhodothermales bacterium]
SRLGGDERTVLDFGCGVGRFTVDLAGLVGGRAIGVDPTQALLDAAPHAENVEYHWIPNGRLPLPDASVDVVWICIVLTCITDPGALQAAITEIRRVLRERGLVFLVENTSAKPDLPHVAFRSVEAYRALFDFAPLRHETDYEDLGERIAVMTGRKGAPADG